MEDFRVSVSGSELRFSAAHFIYNAHFKEPLHGHNYELEVEVLGGLGEDGFVINFLELKELVKKATRSLDHRVLLPTLNPQLLVEPDTEGGAKVSVKCSGGEEYVFPAADVVLLPVRDTSSEELARYLASNLWDMLSALRTNLRALSVTLYETPSYYASYTAGTSSGTP